MLPASPTLTNPCCLSTNNDHRSSDLTSYIDQVMYKSSHVSYIDTLPNRQSCNLLVLSCVHTLLAHQHRGLACSTPPWFAPCQCNAMMVVTCTIIAMSCALPMPCLSMDGHLGGRLPVAHVEGIWYRSHESCLPVPLCIRPPQRDASMWWAAALRATQAAAQ